MDSCVLVAFLVVFLGGLVAVRALFVYQIEFLEWLAELVSKSNSTFCTGFMATAGKERMKSAKIIYGFWLVFLP